MSAGPGCQETEIQLYFAGGEAPSHLKVLRAAGVKRVAINITALSRRTKELAGWATEERLGGFEWILYADSPTTPYDAALELLEGSPCLPEAIVGPVNWATDTRLGSEEFYFIPVWDGIDRSQLRHFIEEYDATFLPDSVVDNQTALRAAQAGASSPTAVLGAITGRSKNLEMFDAVITSAWWAVQKHGETQVWDQGKLHRYNSQDKLTKRAHHQAAIEALGVDFDAVVADDPNVTVELAVRSWLQLEEYQTRKGKLAVISSNTPVEVTDSEVVYPSSSGFPTNGVTNTPPAGRHETATLPVMGLEEIRSFGDEGDSVETLTINTASLRKCDTCSLNMHCPSFSAGADCAFNIPVLIRSKDQLNGVLRAMVEVQTQRVLMGRFGEEVTGAPDPDVGREMDRLFKMVGAWKEIEDNRDTLEMTVRAKGAANSGMLSRLFGSKVGQNAMTFDTAIPSEAVTARMSE